MKATKATILAGAVFDLGILAIPAAGAQTMPDRPAVAPVAEAPAGAAPVAFEKWMKFNGFTWKFNGDRQAAIKTCLTKGGTPLVPAGKVNVQDITFCVTEK